MADNRPLSDNEADDRLKAALNALGEAPGVTVAADTALAAARKALSLLSLGLIAAGVRRELKARPKGSLATNRRTRSVGSPETYVGYERAENFVSPGGAVKDRSHTYADGDPRLNEWGLVGNWTVGPEQATLNAGGGSIVYRFHARDLHLVLSPSADGKPVHRLSDLTDQLEQVGAGKSVRVGVKRGSETRDVNVDIVDVGRSQ